MDLTIKWDQCPSPGSSLTPLLSALLPAADCLRGLKLVHWAVDKNFMVKLRVAFPRLTNLTLWDCRVTRQAWMVVLSMSRLTELGALSHIPRAVARQLALSVGSHAPSPVSPHKNLTAPTAHFSSDGETSSAQIFSLSFRQSHGVMVAGDANEINEVRSSRGMNSINILLE